ncbi:prepilin-type N-terminal cleavage/methylation domain-containing protein [Candidatus Gottesmanbacteria bacterium]|nr:prepilin-type N-terminal cleavage/methylation domain-containing protein [Candidatus Gottesmanbacteria bacterium]
MNKTMKQGNNESMKHRGFTLIEVLVAVTIIAILISIGVVSYGSVNKRSRDAKRKGDVEQLRSALEMYRADTGYYPNTGSGSWADASGLSTPLVSTYLPAIPSDPKSSTQVYRYTATNLSGGNYYGYCLSALIESENPTDTCTPDTNNSHNYGVKSP